MHCGNCNSRNIKTRKNVSHGSGSKKRVSYSCIDCSSTNIIQEVVRKGFKKR